jgi:hypothetical protein
MGWRTPLHLDTNTKRAYVAAGAVLVGVVIFSVNPVLRWMLLGLVVGGAVFGALLIFWKERD